MNVSICMCTNQTQDRDRTSVQKELAQGGVCFGTEGETRTSIVEISNYNETSMLVLSVYMLE